MSCKRCGACCKETTMRIDISAKDPKSIEDYREYLSLHGCNSFIQGDILTVLAPVMCANLGYQDGKGYLCSDYDNRPEICRSFLCKKAKDIEVLNVNVNDTVKTKEATRG